VKEAARWVDVRASVTKFVTTQYHVIGGVRKGTILARDPDGVEKELTLGKQNYGCRDDYILITNFDYYWHDLKEWFDPTAHGKHHLSRRVAAQQLLNRTDPLTPEALFSIIDNYNVRATDTMFQAIMSVEDNLWNVSLPALDEEERRQPILVV